MLEDANLLDNDGENGGSRTAGTSIVLDGVTYATNLFWQPIQRASDFMPEVEEASTDIIEGADLFAIKDGKSPQFGICVSQEGYKVGSNVAAIALMTSLSDFSSIVGVFKVGNGWWYVCSRNDVILSDGDMLYLDEEEAKSQLLSMLTVPDWDKKYAPAHWKLEDTEEGNIADFLSRGKKVKLQKIKALRGTKLVVVIAAVVICAWWVLSSLFDYMAPTQRKVVTPVRPKPIQVEQPVISFPWNEIKNPEGFMDNCYKGIMSLLSLMPPGWDSSGRISCTGETVATSWKSGTGFISWAEETMKRSTLENFHYNFDKSSKSLSASMSLPKLETVAQPPKDSLANLRHELNKVFQETGLNVSLTEKVTTLSVPVNNMQKGPKRNSPAPTIKTLEFKMNSGYTPMVWHKFLTKFSSFEIKKVEYDVKNISWYYEGVFYVL